MRFKVEIRVRGIVPHPDTGKLTRGDEKRFVVVNVPDDIPRDLQAGEAKVLALAATRADLAQHGRDGFLTTHGIDQMAADEDVDHVHNAANPPDVKSGRQPLKGGRGMGPRSAKGRFVRAA